MNCPYCGFLCEEGARFCPSCGKQMSAGDGDVAATASAANIPQIPEAVPPAEMAKRKSEDKTVRRYKGLIIFSLFLALALVVGAVYLMAFMPKENVEPEKATEQEVYVSPAVGSWANEDGYIIMTATGKFAADGVSGTYTMDDTVIVFNDGSTVIIADYTIEEGVLTLVTTYLGSTSEYTYYMVSERTDLTYSQLSELWDGMDS